ncbi:MAG: flagellar export chaperone FlgN, partial [Candidatus Poribacteria bacterium]|nr:flagellar export chaperone FlgN [Candidatus Poribacteria bacterium]
MKGNNMELLLGRLSEILSQEIVQYSRLLDILSTERLTFAVNSAERINEILKQQETLILELKALEEARIAVMNKLVEPLQIEVHQLTLAELASQIEEPFASEYKKLSQKLGELLLQLEQVNQDNAYLIGRSLDYVNSSLRLFAASDLFSLGYLDSTPLKPRQGKQLYKTA